MKENRDLIWHDVNVMFHAGPSVDSKVWTDKRIDFISLYLDGGLVSTTEELLDRKVAAPV
jgi:hypothetical protein